MLAFIWEEGLSGVLWRTPWWKERSPVDERASAVGAGAGSLRGDGGLFLGREVKGEGEMDEGSDPAKRDSGSGVEEAVVADFHEALGEDVLEEAAHELEGREGHGSPSVGVGLFVSEEYGIVVYLEDSVVGDGDPEDIGGEVLEGVSAIAHRLRVDVPGDVPDLGVDLVEECCLFHLIAELGSEEDGQSFDGEEEMEVGGVPGMVFDGDGSSWDDIVDMGVVVELTAPGVKDAEEAWEIGSDVLGISSQGGHGLGRGCEHGIVGGALVAADEGVELLGSGEGDQEMGPWHLPLHLFMEPLMSFLVLTGRAVAVSA